MATINTRIIIRNDSTQNWEANESTVLLKGEVGIEFTSDGKTKQKIGDGVKPWSELPYFGGEEAKTFQVGDLSEITDEERQKERRYRYAEGYFTGCFSRSAEGPRGDGAWRRDRLLGRALSGSLLRP